MQKDNDQLSNNSNDTDLMLKKFESEINLEMNGKLTASFPNSRDFTVAQDAGYKLEYNLKVTDDAKKFEPASSVDKI